MTPRATITMPAYNAEATLRDAVDSALAQTVEDFELVVVDDGSRVRVEEVLADIRDERLRIVRHERNRGLGPTRNTALRSARAPLLCHLDADDRYEPEYLEALLPCFEDPEVGLAYPNAHVFGINEHPYIRDASLHPARLPGLARQNTIPNFSMVRREALESIGGYAEFTWGAMDWYLYLRVAGAGWRFAYVDRILAHYRWTGESMSQDWDKVQRSNLAVLWRFMLHHPLKRGPHRLVAKLALREAGTRIPGARRLKDAAVGRRA
ncbi:MAG TPA: glycosyltransferase family 2 protein [Solirubrobacteraceae bacterium]|jgi:glycosyltransferase involved in cell wall biosynthesis